MNSISRRNQGACFHVWCLYLDPEVPDVVAVICTACSALLDDVWPGATRNVHMKMADFTVVDGTHTATRTVIMPLDVRLRQSIVGSRAGGFSMEFATEVQPRTTGISGSASGYRDPREIEQ